MFCVLVLIDLMIVVGEFVSNIMSIWVAIGMLLFSIFRIVLSKVGVR